MAESGCLDGGCQGHRADACRKIDADLPFNRNGLKRERPARSSDQSTCTNARAKRHISTYARVSSRQRSLRDALRGCHHGPDEMSLLHAPELDPILDDASRITVDGTSSTGPERACHCLLLHDDQADPGRQVTGSPLVLRPELPRERQQGRQASKRRKRSDGTSSKALQLGIVNATPRAPCREAGRFLAPWPPRQRAHRPRPDGSLRIVARGDKKDEAALIGAATA
jgi:hypothetical protein